MSPTPNLAPVAAEAPIAVCPTAPAPASATPAAQLRSVSKIFGNFVALRRCTLTLATGSSTVLLGENGAGKSTLLRLLSGLHEPTQGEVEVFGDAPRNLRHRIAYVSHSSGLYDELTALENLRYFASLRRSGAATCACTGNSEMALRAVGLDPNLTRTVGQYSQGMRQRASLALALQADPDLLLLDEPFSNLDVTSSRAMVELLADVRTWPSAHGAPARTLVLTTHQATLAQPLADRTITMHRGEILADTDSTA